MFKKNQNLIIFIIIIIGYFTDSVFSNSNLIVPKYQTFLDARIDRVINESRSLPVPLRSTYDSSNYKFLEIISAIRENYYNAANLLYEQSEHTIPLKTLISYVYDNGNNIDSVVNVINFLNEMKNTRNQYRGYHLLYDEIVANEKQYTTQTTLLAYQIINVLDLKHSENDDIKQLLNKMPQSFRHVDWTVPVYVRNLIKYDGLYGNYTDDNLKRTVITATPWDCQRPLCEWSIVPMDNGYYFYIKNLLNDEYLYAEEDIYNLDELGLRHRVYTWMNKTEIANVETLKWQIEPTIQADFFKIKNVHLNEYLFIQKPRIIFISDILNVLKGHEVFTKCLDNCDYDGCFWQIHNSPIRFETNEVYDV